MRTTHTRKELLSLLTPEFLHDVYNVKKLTVIEIARLVGCRNGTVCELLDTYGIRNVITKEWLIEHYVNNQESIDDIAAHFGRTEAAIRRQLRENNIPIRYKSRGRQQIKELNDYQWLYHHYIELNLSSPQICDMLWCTQSNVIVALRRFKIPVRPRGNFTKVIPKDRKRYFSNRKRRLILHRDKHTCQMPGCGGITDLEIHHIVPIRDGGDNDMNNGITLCSTCHDKTLRREEDFYYLFKTIVTTIPGAAHLVSTPLQLSLLA